MSNKSINQKNFLVARDYLHKAVKLVKAMPTSERNVRALMKYYKNLGECYAKLRMIDSSAIVLQNILDTPDLPTNFYANANKGIGILYLQNGLANKALFTLEIALEQYYTAFSDKHPDIAATYLNIGDVYLDLGYDSLALTNYQLAINNLVIDFNELNDCNINPAIDDDISSDADLIKILHKKALVQQVINNPENALNTIDLAAQLITRLRTAFQSTNSKVFLNENTRQILETGINISLELFEKTKNVTYLTKVFGFSDNYKATILQESILKLEVLEKLAIPDSIRYTLSSLKNNISFYKRKIEEARGNDKAQLESAKFDLEQELQKIQEQIKIEYPVYADLLDVPDYHSVEIAQLQEQIQAGQALIEYFYGDSTIYTFTITKNDLQITQTPKADISNQIAAFRAALNNPSSDANSLLQFQQQGQTLYQLLLEKSIKNLPPAINELIIIRDGDLFALPFEVLIQQSNPQINSWANLAYLQNEYTISYALSATLLMNQQQKEANKFDKDFVGFAPLFNGNRSPLASRSCSIDSLSRLDFNESEVGNIVGIIGGESLMGIAANKGGFLQQIKGARILHLATHACIDDQNPDQSRIYFTDDYFYLHELYNLDVKAEMVVLSACETGIGEYQHGEGMMSLAHGFAYAGVPSITTSLWSVNDKTTAELMEYYYGYLKEGLLKHQALRQAKLAYLQNQESNQQLHPYYWASFVHVGNYGAVFKNRPNWMLGILGIIGLCSIGLYYRNKRTTDAL